MSRKRLIIASAIVVIVALAIIIPMVTSSSGSSGGSSVIIVTTVQARTLKTTVQLTGSLTHKKIRNVTAMTEGIVNGIYTKEGGKIADGQPLFSLNGREAIAEPGTVPFFRQLVPGDIGQDVIELKNILSAAGDYPGTMSDLFTQQTRFALAQWQAQHHYPNSTPSAATSVTAALQQGTGYQIGPEDSAGLVIGPPPAQSTYAKPPKTESGTTTSSSAGAGAGAGGAGAGSSGSGAGGAATGGQSTGTTSGASGAQTTAYVRKGLGSSLRTFASTGPSITIQSVSAQVTQGQAATFVLTASGAPSSDLAVNLSTEGTATSSDIVSPPSSAEILAGSTQTSVTVQTRFNNEIEPSKTIIVSVQPGTGYSVGSPATAHTTITNTNVPQIHLVGTTRVPAGGTATLKVVANEAPLANTQVFLSFAGDASPGSQYQVPDPVVTLPAGSTSASFTLTTLSSQESQPNTYIVVSLTPSPASYSVESPDAAVVTIGGSTSKPTLTLTSAEQSLQKGEPYIATIGLSEAQSTPLVVNLSYGGTAKQGVDYSVPAGKIIVPPGQTSLPVSISTIEDDTVETSRILTVSLAPSGSYQIGTPNTASVTITSAVLPKLTITSSTTSLTSGGAATFTITANQAVAKNTSVGFVIGGTAQPGQDFEPLPGSVLLLAGHKSVVVTFQSIRKDVVFLPTDMIVANWPTRIGTVSVKAGSPVSPGTSILNLTQSSLSVTLQASAADRSNLSVGEKATVEISGNTVEVPGEITELNSTPTTTASASGGGAQTYSGTITLSDISALHGTDGAAVSINVIDQEALKAPSVPIAAVAQNGIGAQVVRVIKSTGKIDDVPVTTGLTDGSYIQIKKGLNIGQNVIVQADQSK